MMWQIFLLTQTNFSKNHFNTQMSKSQNLLRSETLRMNDTGWIWLQILNISYISSIFKYKIESNI